MIHDKQDKLRPPQRPDIQAPAGRVMPRPAPVLKAASDAHSTSSNKTTSLQFMRKKEPAPTAAVSKAGNSPDYMAIFREELSGYWTTLQRAFSNLQDNLQDENNWSVIKRTCHTINGAAATLGQESLSRLAAQVENEAQSAVETPEKRTVAFLEHLQKIIRQAMTASGTAFSVNPDSSPPFNAGADTAQDPDANIKLPLLNINNLLTAWENDPGQSRHQDDLLQQLLFIQKKVADLPAPELAQSFGQLADFVSSIHSTPTETFFLVTRRCLADASNHLKVREGNPSLHWNRKWNFYFSSLRVAMATEIPGAGVNRNTKAQDNGSPDPEILGTFTDEAISLFETIEQSLLGWEQGVDTAPHKENVRRCFHTLKGAANSIGLRNVGASFHILEDFLDTMEPDHPAPGSLQFLLRCIDQGREYLGLVRSNADAPWTFNWQAEIQNLKSGAGNSLTGSPAPAVDPEMLETFSEEASLLFEQIESALLAWEHDESQLEHKAVLRRCFHTLKGAANSIGLQAMGSGYHVLEDMMESLQPGNMPAGLFQFLLNCQDDARNFVNALHINSATTWKYNWAGQINSLRTGSAPSDHTTETGPKSTGQEKQPLRVEAEKLRNLMHWANELVAEHSRFSTRLPKTQNTHLRIRECLNRLDQSIETVAEEAARREQAGLEIGGPLDFLKVELQSLSNDLNLGLIEVAGIVESSREEDLLLRRKGKRL